MINIRSFRQELQKLALDPATIAAATATGKILASNFLHRFGLQIPLYRRAASELIGVGLRSGLKGQPLLNPTTRHGLALLTDPTLIRVYEAGHSAGRHIRALQNLPAGPGTVVSGMLRQPADLQQALVKAMPSIGLGPEADVIQNIPLQSTGGRRVLDYLLTPVSQVGRDIGTALQARRPHEAAKELGRMFEAHEVQKKRRAAAQAIKDSLQDLAGPEAVQSLENAAQAIKSVLPDLPYP